VKSAKGVTVAVLSGRGWDARHARPKRGADKGTLLAGNGFLLTGGGQMSPARLLRLAGLLILQPHLLFASLVVCAAGAGLMTAPPA
jgi:hypothetical protein